LAGTAFLWVLMIYYNSILKEGRGQKGKREGLETSNIVFLSKLVIRYDTLSVSCWLVLINFWGGDTLKRSSCYDVTGFWVIRSTHVFVMQKPGQHASCKQMSQTVIWYKWILVDYEIVTCNEIVKFYFHTKNVCHSQSYYILQSHRYLMSSSALTAMEIYTKTSYYFRRQFCLQLE